MIREEIEKEKAAIVSRALGIPCVVGTKIATKVLKDGDLVETCPVVIPKGYTTGVNAEEGAVKLLKG